MREHGYSKVAAGGEGVDEYYLRPKHWDHQDEALRGKKLMREHPEGSHGC